MPKTEEILSGLHAIANNKVLFAIIWHAVFYLLIVFLVIKWTPSNRLLGVLMCLPLLSVAILAWLSGNPFNGALFTVAAILVLVFGLKASSEPVSLSQWPFVTMGIIMIVFGLVYPHFLETGSVLKYIYASPAGLIPCPTLSVLIGFLLLFHGFGSQSLSLTFIILGLFYGVFGVLKLAVYLDVFLIAGTLALLGQYLLALRK